MSDLTLYQQGEIQSITYRGSLSNSVSPGCTSASGQSSRVDRLSGLLYGQRL
jgi:hypothetical protein